MFDPARLDNAAGMFMDVAFGKNGWTAALTSLSDALDAFGIVLMPVSSRVPGQLPTSHGYGETIDTYVREGWFTNDVRLAGVPAMLRKHVIDDNDSMPFNLLTHTSYYNDFMRKCGIGPFAAMSVPYADELVAIAISRPLDGANFQEEEIIALKRIRPRIIAGAQISAQLDSARNSGISDSLDAMPDAAALLDREGKVIRMNAACTALLTRGLVLRYGYLGSNHRANSANAQTYLRMAITPVEYAHPVASRPFLLTREDRFPLILRAQRLTGLCWHYFSQAWGLVLINDPETGRTPQAELLGALFQLTPAETRVALEVLEGGKDARALSDDLGLSHETVRHHLKSIFAKTGARTQAGLVSLLLRL